VSSAAFVPDCADPLRIAMVAPPWFDVPPPAYGGVEAVVADLVDDLAARGHEITLIGAGRHLTAASRFIPLWPEPPSERLGEPFPEVVHAARVATVLDDLDVDIVHDHSMAGPLLGRGRRIPTVITVHGPVVGEEGEYYHALGNSVRMVAISEAQRSTAPGLPWAATVHNAIRAGTFPFRADKEPFALFLGRMSPSKGPHLAIDAARAANVPIILAGKCSEPSEQAYFEREIKPRLGGDVEFFGVADAAAKRDLLSRACVLMFPICWEEPFGLVMIEAMACGTPVVAMRRGSVPEIVVNGVTGIITDDPGRLPAALDLARRLDPVACRAHVAARFTTELMAARYEDAYLRILADPGAAVSSAQASRPAWWPMPDRVPASRYHNGAAARTLARYQNGRAAPRTGAAPALPATAGRHSPAPARVSLLDRERVQGDSHHGLAKPARHLRDYVGVVVERGRLDDRGGSSGGIA
jgi:glycosyltransferase involved in cell wall biosynthesis